MSVPPVNTRIRWPEGLAIRARIPADAATIATMHNLPGYRAGTLRPPYENAETIRKTIEATTPGTVNLVAILADQVVGEISLNMSSGRRNHAASIGMGVHDDFTGRGIGSALMGEVVAMADAWLNLLRLELTVFVDNAPAIALYQKFGFEVEGCHKAFAFRDGTFVDALSMARINTRR